MKWSRFFCNLLPGNEVTKFSLLKHLIHKREFALYHTLLCEVEFEIHPESITLYSNDLKKVQLLKTFLEIFTHKKVIITQKNSINTMYSTIINSFESSKLYDTLKGMDVKIEIKGLILKEENV